MTQDDPAMEAELHAYADGFLTGEQRARVESWLAENPQAAAMVADWQAQNAALRNLFAPYEKSLPGDREMLRPAPALRLRALRRPAMQLAAACLVFAAGIGTAQIMPPLFARAPDTLPVSTAGLSDQARSAYLIYASEVRHPVEVGADEETHLATWLGKRLDYPFTIPDLSSLGFSLVGGRLVPVSGQPGAMLMYEDGSGQRVTVLAGRNPENRSTSFRLASNGPVETFYWIDGQIGYAVSGEISRERLLAVAQECYRQFPS